MTPVDDAMTPVSDLALYYEPACPYCLRVLRAMRRLGVDIELRDVVAEPRWREELFAARGRGTVPVLRIAHPDGPVEWMPESLDIVAYLERRFA